MMNEDSVHAYVNTVLMVMVKKVRINGNNYKKHFQSHANNTGNFVITLHFVKPLLFWVPPGDTNGT